MDASRAHQFLALVQERHPRFLKGILESRDLDKVRFNRCADQFLGWAVDAFGPDIVTVALDAFVRFTTDVNFAQAQYEVCGHYATDSFAECEKNLYGVEGVMRDYLLGVYMTTFLWAHHLDLMGFFEERFLPRLSASTLIRELAPGHGGWGLWALQVLDQAHLEGYDISGASIELAPRLRDAAGFTDRATYHRMNVLDLPDSLRETADACLCCFLVEHLEQPHRLLEVMAAQLKPGGWAFFTGALTAAQGDHIAEFQQESELVRMAELAGFRVLEMRSTAPSRTLPRARFLPRSAAYILQKRAHESW